MLISNDSSASSSPSLIERCGLEAVFQAKGKLEAEIRIATDKGQRLGTAKYKSAKARIAGKLVMFVRIECTRSTFNAVVRTGGQHNCLYSLLNDIDMDFRHFARLTAGSVRFFAPTGELSADVELDADEDVAIAILDEHTKKKGQKRRKRT